MRVKLCQQCGYQLARKAKKCPWCKAPVKRKTALLISILAVFASPVFVAWFLDNKITITSPPPEPAQPKVVRIIIENPPLKKPRENFSIVYVKGQTVNLRKNPSLESHTILKLKKGQRLTQVSRSGDWLQVQADGSGNRPGWVHTSLVGRTKPLSTNKAPSEEKAFKMFRKSFDQFNANIKRLKGMTFFNDVEYLDHGVIQVTATDILLSAPKRYKENYVMTLMQMWLELRDPNLPAAVRIVDAGGRLRLEEVRRE